MPRLDGMDTHNIGRGGFAFTGARIDRLGSTEQTLVTVATDVTGSLMGYEAALQKMEQEAIAGCRKSPRSDNVMVRLIRFASNSRMPKGIEEVFGFTPLMDIDVAAIPPISVGGGTPLYDAVYSAIGATNEYAKQLRDADFGVNSIVFIITDGDDNTSVATRKMVKDEQAAAVTSESLDSHLSILIGMNTAQYGPYLQQLKQEAGINQYVDMGDVTPQRLAKLADFVSTSVSLQSQALGTGGPSKQIPVTI